MIMNVIFSRHLAISRNIDFRRFLISQHLRNPSFNRAIRISTHCGHRLRPLPSRVRGIGSINSVEPIRKIHKIGFGVGADTSRSNHSIIFAAHRFEYSAQSLFEGDSTCCPRLVGAKIL